MAKGSHINSRFKIQFERTGGFAGIPLTLNIDSESLINKQAEELRRLIKDSDFFNLTSVNMDASVIPDSFTFLLTLEVEGHRYTLRTSEGKIPPQLKPLIEYLTGIARKLRSSSTTKNFEGLL